MTAPSGRCGDLALTFGPEEPVRSRGGSAWQLLHQAGQGGLWATPVSEAWNGYPLQVRDDGARTSFILGDERDHWLSVEHERRTDEWRVRTDRFATLQAYRRVGREMVSTFSPSLWGDGPRLDWGAIAGFLANGWYPGDRLPVEDVRILRPATIHRWDGRGRHRGEERERTWRHRPSEEPPERQVDRVAGRLGAILTERRDEADALGLPLSGGLDSRSTLAVLTDAGRSPARSVRAFSYGYEADSIELAIARELARCRGLDLHEHVIEPSLVDELDVVLDATEGLVDVVVCRQADLRNWLTAETEAVVAAHWGDVWFGMTPSVPADDPAARLLTASRRRGAPWLVEHVVGDRVGDVDAVLSSIFEEEVDRLPPLGDPTVRAAALKTEQWSFRFTEASLRMHQAASDPVLPYYDPRLTDLILTLPTELLTGRRLQIDHLRRHAPDLAAVTWEAYETDLFGLDRRRTTGLPPRIARAVRRRLRPPTAVLENWEVQFSARTRDRWRRWLDSSGSIAELPDPGAVADVLGAATGGDRDAGHVLSRLVTFCAWRDRFAR